MFISKQHTRCSSCHFSPTGGGLLTPYGRSLSREELSTAGRTAGNLREQEFLCGLLGSTSTRLNLGLSIRPARLSLDFDGGSVDRNFLMNADVIGAFRSGAWTACAEAGRQGRTGRPAYKSFEHWVAYQRQRGLGVRVGRFLPAYGIRVADHSSCSRAPLGFGTMDQVYAVEVSHVSEKRLLQVSIGPGRADSWLPTMAFNPRRRPGGSNTIWVRGHCSRSSSCTSSQSAFARCASRRRLSPLQTMGVSTSAEGG